MADNPFAEIDALTSAPITQGLSTLLQEKHLYQSVTAAVAEVIPTLFKGQRGHPFDKIRSDTEIRVAGRWVVFTPHVVVGKAAGAPDTSYRVRVPDIKVFCATCDRDEPFNCIASADVLPYGKEFGQAGSAVQVFALSYLCQSCKSVPEVFLVRRAGAKLIYCGRAPMAAVQLPPELPKKGAGKYVSDAIVAFQSGQVLAALFLLRVFVEQWLREVGAPQGAKVDECVAWYAGQLPREFSQRFPSLGTVYSNLSGAIHAADASSEIYRQALDDLVRHFDARRVFRLPDQYPATSEKAASK